MLEACNASDIRPLTDVVTAVAPEVITYDIEIVYYTTPETEAEVVANVEGTSGAIDRYNEWQVGALGRDINPDQLRKRILCPSWGENLPRGRDQAGLHTRQRHTGRQVQRAPDCQP